METNIDKIKEQLSGMLGKISGNDRMDAANALGCHIETVNRYLRGEVKKEAFGLELLQFFKTQIVKREKALA